MLSPSLICAVERDLTVARQLAYFHVGYSPDGQDMEVEPEHFVHGEVHDRDDSAASLAVHIRVAISNLVQRPRQGTCAVLMELTRPLTWLSHRGRQRGAAGGGGVTSSSAAAASTGTATAGGGAGSANINGAPGSPASSTTTGTAAGGGFLSRSAAGSGVGGPASLLSKANAATAPSAGSISGGGGRGGHGTSASSSAPALPPANATPATTNASGPSLLPLLVATATLEVVFPVHYPHEPCRWHLSEEGSFSGLGDHSTSSWAVTASPRAGSRPGVWSAGPSAAVAVEEGVPRRHVSSRLLAATVGENTMRPGKEAGQAGGGAALGDGPTRLTAFVVPALGRQLLRWMTERRNSSSSSVGTGRGDMTPFLLDVACLLRCWSAVELDVHHLVLPSRIALAYGGVGGGGGSGGSSAAAAAVVGASGRGGERFGAVNRATGTSGGGALSPLASGATSHNTATNPSSTHSTATAAVTAAAAAAALQMNPLASSVGGSAGTSSTATVMAAAAAGAAVSAAGTGAAGTLAGGGGGGGGPTSSTTTGASALYPHRRRAVKTFLAVLLPQGDVAVCGGAPAVAIVAPAPRRGTGIANGSGGGGGAQSSTAASATAPANTFTKKGMSAEQLARVPHCLQPLSEHLQRWAQADATSASTTPQHRAAAPAPGTLLSVTTQLVRGKVLPSVLLPSHVLGSPYKCEWDDISLFTGQSAEAALHTAAKLAKALRLPVVSDLFQVLRRLARNVGRTTTGDVYLGEVLWPTLMETVNVLRSSRQPLWAGVAVCALLLPSVLDDDAPQQRVPGVGTAARAAGGRRVLPTSTLAHGDGAAAAAGRDATGSGGRPPRQWRRMFADLIDVVLYTERLFTIAQEYTLLCEARLVRCALQRGQQQLTQQPASSPTAPLRPHHYEATVTPPVELCRRLHAPISVCAVCGLSLLRNTVKQRDGAKEVLSRLATSASVEAMVAEVEGRRGVHADPAADSAAAAAAAAVVAGRVAAARRSLLSRGAEGCLVVQCARCGHGGHVEHMSSWWNDPTVHCCPKGCDCICEY